MGKYLNRLAVMTVAMLIFGVTGAVGSEVEFEPVRAPSVGPDNASVTIYEIADFMWPFCKEAGPTFKRIKEEYKGKIRFVFVPYMRSYSENSRNTALAAFAAWDQGKFWEMHDLIFDKAPEIDRTVLSGLAKELGLDMKKFAAGMDDKKLLDELTETRARVRALDIWSTPTLIINGKILKGQQPFEKYKEIIDEALGSTSEGSVLRRASSALRTLMGPRSAHAAGGAFGEGKVPLFVKAPALKSVNDLRVGQRAPDFELPSTLGNNIKLSDYYGKKNVLLSFLPAAFTPV